jgi:hypothetical protein
VPAAGEGGTALDGAQAANCARMTDSKNATGATAAKPVRRYGLAVETAPEGLRPQDPPTRVRVRRRGMM